MSKYLQIKMQRALEEAKALGVNGLVDGSIDNLKNKIEDVKVEGGYEKFLEKVEHKPNYQGTELAEVAIDVYRSNIKPKEVKDYIPSTEQPITHASRENTKAIARSLAGMRNGGDGGRLRQDAGPNGGDMRVGDGRVIHTEEKSVADMTVEEYEEYISNQYVTEEEEEIIEEESILIQEEDGPVKDLEEKLLEMTDHSWQAIDKEMRIIAKEYDITPKELHKEFKTAHNGQIPDEWIKDNVKVEQCGWFPIEEAVLHKNGRAYDVTLIWRGHTRRLKFFWPKPSGATRSDMQRAVELFYPNSRLITFYPTQEDNNGFMVVVPPITESYEVITEEEWVEFPGEVIDLVNKIEDVEGQIISIPEISDLGIISFLISDNETGEHKMVYMGEDDMKGMSQKSGDKRSTESGAGLTAKGVAKYRAKNPGSKLKTAVTTPPSKLKAGSKAAGRRKSFCARSRGWNGERGKAARARWNC